MFGNSVIKREEWNELRRILVKYKIGYTACYDDLNDDVVIRQVQINKIDVIYTFDDESEEDFK